MKEEILPVHLGFIVDGNRRWAKERGLPTLDGHKLGLDKVEEVAKECFERGVKYTSFYLFSTENWNRSKEEVGYLMNLAKTMVMGLAKKMAKNNIKLVVLGSKERVDKALLESFAKAEDMTKDGEKGVMGVCFNYGGRKEIVDAANSIEGELTEEKITAALYGPEIPDCDMVVRTSGEQRISGFMLWRAAYAEFLFLSKYWPDMDKEDVAGVLAEFAHRSRRFGK